MTQLLDALPGNYSNGILCSYLNTSHQIQIVRISEIPGWYFERVVFPDQTLLFEAPAEAHLEIHTPTSFTILGDLIPCSTLRVQENG